MSLTPSTINQEENEVPIEEVRCSVTGMPISSIPAWYATVKVNFVSEQGRKKNNIEYEIPIDLTTDTDTDSLLDRSANDYEDIELEDDDVEIGGIAGIEMGGIEDIDAEDIVDTDIDPALASGDAEIA
jgi:hypothetical protein